MRYIFDDQKAAGESHLKFSADYPVRFYIGEDSMLQSTCNVKKR